MRPRRTRLWRALGAVFGLMAAIWIVSGPAVLAPQAGAREAAGPGQLGPIPVPPAQAFVPGLPGGGGIPGGDLPPGGIVPEGGAPGGGGLPQNSPGTYDSPGTHDRPDPGPDRGGSEGRSLCVPGTSPDCPAPDPGPICNADNNYCRGGEAPTVPDPGPICGPETNYCKGREVPTVPDPGPICNADNNYCRGGETDGRTVPDSCETNPALCDPCRLGSSLPGCGSTPELQCPQDPAKCVPPVTETVTCPPLCAPPTSGIEGCPPTCPPPVAGTACPADPATCPPPPAGRPANGTAIPGPPAPGTPAALPVPDPTVPPAANGLVLSAPAAQPGAGLTVAGAGCPPGRPVRMTFGGAPAGTVTADEKGAFQAPLSAGSVDTGRYQVSADCGGAIRNAPLDVVLVSRSGGATSTAVVIVFFLLVGLLVYRRRLLPVESR
ncbi:hypothetical protein GCM10023094_40650 [Rhodococcus olei]|uniref:Ig-like domain-containing protein n=1 Tax=Rhodococcus olei TaxID=2161675 RepID=A0ABP8PFC4_9NOCA